MKPTSRPAVVDGADLSLPAFLLMPVFAAGLSVAMWLQMPTLRDALESRGDRIEERRTAFARLAAGLPPGEVPTAACASPVVPPPRFDESDRWGAISRSSARARAATSPCARVSATKASCI